MPAFRAKVSATIEFPARRYRSATEVETAVNGKGHTGDEACFH